MCRFIFLRATTTILVIVITIITILLQYPAQSKADINSSPEAQSQRNLERMWDEAEDYREKYKRAPHNDHPPTSQQPDPIIGGEASSPYFRNIIVLIRSRYRTGRRYLFCSAVRIGPRSLLTAAHCVPPDSRGYMQVYPEFNGTFSRRPIIIRRSSMYPHPNFTRGNLGYDIAVLRFRGPDSYFTPRYPIYKKYQNWSVLDLTRNCLALGLGTTNRTQFQIPGRVKQISATIRTTDSSTLYFQARRWNGPCYGDSGGPVLCPERHEYVIAGIMSVGPNQCHSMNLLYGATRTDVYRVWIRRHEL